MDQEIITAIRLVEELRGIFTRMGINANRDQAILLGQANDTLDELEDYNIPQLKKVFGD